MFSNKNIDNTEQTLILDYCQCDCEESLKGSSADQDTLVEYDQMLFFNVSIEVHTFLRSMLQCLDPIGKISSTADIDLVWLRFMVYQSLWVI